MSYQSDAIRTANNIIRLCDIDVDNIMFSVYDRASGDDASIPYGSHADETFPGINGDTELLDELNSMLDLDGGLEYERIGMSDIGVSMSFGMSCYVYMPEALEAVNEAIADGYVDSACVEVNIYDTDTGNSECFNLGDQVAADEVDTLMILSGRDDIDEIADRMTEITNLERYDVPGKRNIGVDVSLGEFCLN